MSINIKEMAEEISKCIANNKKKSVELCKYVGECTRKLLQITARATSCNMKEISEEDRTEYHQVLCEHDYARLDLLKLENDRFIKEKEALKFFNHTTDRDIMVSSYECFKLVLDTDSLEGKRVHYLYKLDRYRGDKLEEANLLEIYTTLVEETYKRMKIGGEKVQDE